MSRPPSVFPLTPNSRQPRHEEAPPACLTGYKVPQKSVRYEQHDKRTIWMNPTQSTSLSPASRLTNKYCALRAPRLRQLTGENRNTLQGQKTSPGSNLSVRDEKSATTRLSPLTTCGWVQGACQVCTPQALAHSTRCIGCCRAMNACLLLVDTWETLKQYSWFWCDFFCFRFKYCTLFSRLLYSSLCRGSLHLSFTHGGFHVRETRNMIYLFLSKNLYASYCLISSGLTAVSLSITRSFMRSFKGFSTI